MRRQLCMCVVVACGPILAATVSVDPADVKAEISTNIYGLGMEDVNHEIYGGLDAQRLYGESFEEPAPPPGGDPLSVRLDVSGGWTVARCHPGEFVHDRTKAHWGAASQLLSPNGAAAAIANRGLGNWGVPARKGRRMTGCLYACGSVSALRVRLVSADEQKELAAAELDAAPGEAWKRLDFVLTPDADDPAARFEIVALGYGKIWVDDAYLADEPTNAFGRIGCREDVAAELVRSGVSFLRWGGTMCNAEDYLLKNFDGTRRPYCGYWHRYGSCGFGVREFVRLAATMKLPCAFSISAREDVADAVKLAEELKACDIPIVVEIGNEECIVPDPASYRQYCAHVRRLVPPMRKANPKLTFASAAWWDEDFERLEPVFRELDGLVEYWDLHPFFITVEQCLGSRMVIRRFLNKIREWNPQTTMRAAVFEENGTRQDVSRALCHALVLEEIRAAGGDVLTSCPANAFQAYGRNDNGWDQGNVFFTQDKTWLSPCGWAQRMASEAHRGLLVASASDDATVHVSAARDRAGTSLVLHVVNRADAPKRVDVVTKDGTARRVTRALSLWGDLTAVNTPDAPTRVSPKDVTAACRDGLALEPHSYTVVTLETVR